MTLQVASLFTGVGGIDLAFERAGAPTRLMCEYDKAARSVLARHYPGVPIHHDVRELTHHDLTAAGLRPDTTIVTGGFPCQDLSLAGARRGMGHGTRSGLFWHIIRLLADFRAAWVVLENVPGILSATCPCTGDGACLARGAVRCPGDLHSVTGGACEGGCVPTHGGVMGAVIGALGELGYGLAWRVLDAQHFGVPQRRRRVVIVGRLGDSGAAPARVLLEPYGSRGDLAEGVEEGPDTTPGAARGAGVPSLSPTLTSPRRGQRYNPDEALIVSALTAASGGPDDNDAQAGHLVVTPLALRGRGGGSQLEVGSEAGPFHTLRAGDGGSSRSALVAISTRGHHTHTLTAEGFDAGEDGTGRGTPIIAATLTAGMSSSGVSAPGRRNEDDVNLVAFDGTGITPTLAGSRPHAIASDTQVRRLTPLECERLQGFPDGWTAGQADSPRYRQMGNAVAVPVFEWVARRVIAEDSRMRREVRL